MSEKAVGMRAIAEAFASKADPTKRKAGKVTDMVAPHKSPEIANALRRCREAAEALKVAKAEVDAADAELLRIVKGSGE